MLCRCDLNCIGVCLPRPCEDWPDRPGFECMKRCPDAIEETKYCDRKTWLWGLGWRWWWARSGRSLGRAWRSHVRLPRLCCSVRSEGQWLPAGSLTVQSCRARTMHLFRGLRGEFIWDGVRSHMRLERYPECLRWGCRRTLFLQNRLH